MQTICEYLAQDHKRCDDLFLRVEVSIAQGDWEQAGKHFQCFYEALLAHVDSEDKIVLPAFEKTVANAAVPLAILRMEHRRIRGIAVRLQESLARRDRCDFLLHAETLTILMQEHGEKEEDMLYPLLDRLLSRNALHVVNALRQAIDLPAATH